MKLIKLIPLILFFSCINLITQSNDYNSLYFQGGSWIECPKIETMQLYESEIDNFPFPRSEKNIRSLAAFRGSQSGYEAAEAFELVYERK